MNNCSAQLNIRHRQQTTTINILVCSRLVKEHSLFLITRAVDSLLG